MLPIMTVHPKAAALLVSFATLIAVQPVPFIQHARMKSATCISSLRGQ